MDRSYACCLAGVLLIFLALLLHTVCVATPYFITADFSDLQGQIEDLDLTPLDRSFLVNVSRMGYSVDSGLWSLCYRERIVSDDLRCKRWDEGFNPGNWVKAAQSLAILSVMAMGSGVILSCLLLWWRHRGQQVHFMSSLVGGICCLGGVMSLCGDTVVAAHLASDVLVPLNYPFSPAVKFVVGQLFRLYWGFGLDIVVFLLACAACVAHVVGGHMTDESPGLVVNPDL